MHGRARTEARLFKGECNRARQKVEGALLQRLITRRRAATFFKPVNDAPAVEQLEPTPPTALLPQASAG